MNIIIRTIDKNLYIKGYGKLSKFENYTCTCSLCNMTWQLGDRIARFKHYMMCKVYRKLIKETKYVICFKWVNKWKTTNKKHLES
jgi:hypothetical protein